MDLKELEELFKSKQFGKNPAMVNALLRNAALLHDPNATEEQKAIALENVKSISKFGTLPKKVKEKKPEAEVQPKIKQPKQPKQAGLQYNPDYAAYNVTPEIWNAMSHDHRNVTVNFHKEKLAGKTPTSKQPAPAAAPQPTATAVKPEPSLPSNVIPFKPKIKKSLDSLYNLFEYLKKNLDTLTSSNTDSTKTN